MREDGNAPLLVDGCDRFRDREVHGDGLGHPQAEDVATVGGNFHPGDNIEGVAVTLAVSPQAGIQGVVVGNGNHIQVAAFSDIIQHLLGGGDAIAGVGMDVDISSACQLLYSIHLFAFNLKPPRVLLYVFSFTLLSHNPIAPVISER